MLLTDLLEAREEYVASQWGDQIRAAYNNDMGDRYIQRDDPDVDAPAIRNLSPVSIVKKISKIEPRYVQWLTKMYITGQFKLEDASRMKLEMEKFNRLRTRLQRKDINQYKSLPDLYGAMKPFEHVDTKSNRQKDKQMRADLVKSGAVKEFYKDDQIRIVIPKTEEAACVIGRGTKWCTASTESHNYFDEYNDVGPLYVIYTNDNRKYQLHITEDHHGHEQEMGDEEDFEWQESVSEIGDMMFMDEHDQPVDPVAMVKKYPSIAKAFHGLAMRWGVEGLMDHSQMSKKEHSYQITYGSGKHFKNMAKPSARQKVEAVKALSENIYHINNPSLELVKLALRSADEEYDRSQKGSGQIPKQRVAHVIKRFLREIKNPSDKVTKYLTDKLYKMDPFASNKPAYPVEFDNSD